MRWFRRLFQSGKRSIASLPWISGGPRASKMTSERALSVIPFFASVRLLADSVASLPLQAYRKNGDGRTPIATPRLLEDPEVVGTQFDWLHKCVVSLAYRGNAYGLITETDGMGFPVRVEWLNPDEVDVDDRRPTLPVYQWQGNAVDPSRLVHIRWFTLPGKVEGLSPVSAFARTLGINLEATKYGEDWFKNGGQPPGVFRNTEKTVNAGDAEVITDRLVTKMRSGKPLVIGSDWEYNALSVSPNESQFIETMKLNATQIANIFGIPPEMLGGETGRSMTYNTQESEALKFVTLTLRPWLVRIEQAFSALLPDKQYAKFNVDALVRAELKTRYEAHHIALSDGWKNKDEIRALEDLPPLPNGEGQEYLKIAAPAPTDTPVKEPTE